MSPFLPPSLTLLWSFCFPFCFFIQKTTQRRVLDLYLIIKTKPLSGNSSKTNSVQLIDLNVQQQQQRGEEEEVSLFHSLGSEMFLHIDIISLSAASVVISFIFCHQPLVFKPAVYCGDVKLWTLKVNFTKYFYYILLLYFPPPAVCCKTCWCLRDTSPQSTCGVTRRPQHKQCGSHPPRRGTFTDYSGVEER